MKKILIILLVTLLIPMKMNASSLVNDAEVLMTHDEILKLEALGFDSNQINQMDQFEFEANKELQGQVVSKNTKYYKTIYYNQNNQHLVFTATKNKFLSLPIVVNEEVSESEYDGVNAIENYAMASSVSGTYQTSYKKITTSIIAINGRYRYKNDLVRKIMPSNRSYDVHGILQDSTVSGIPSTKYAKQIWQEDNPCLQQTINKSQVITATGNWKMLPSGYGVTIKLPETSRCTVGAQYHYINVVSLSSYMYYEVQKLLSTPINTLNAYGSYQHSIEVISINTSLSFGISSNGLGGVIAFTPTVIKSFDGMSGTQAYITGINW